MLAAGLAGQSGATHWRLMPKEDRGGGLLMDKVGYGGAVVVAPGAKIDAVRSGRNPSVDGRGRHGSA